MARIITVSVELDDLFSEEEGEGFSDILKDAIKRDTKNAVLELWKADVGSAFAQEVKSSVDELSKGFLKATIESLLDQPQVKKSYYSDEKVSLREYLKEVMVREFEQRAIDRRISEEIVTLGNKMSADLKNRYDAAFATSIVRKLSDNKMLNENVSALLLGHSETPS